MGLNDFVVGHCFMLQCTDHTGARLDSKIRKYL